MPEPHARAGPTNGAQGETNEDMPDRAVLRANTHAEVGREQVRAQFAAFLAAHTTVPSTSFKVSGPEAGRSFTLRFGGTLAIAARHAGEAFQKLRDGAGQWRQHLRLAVAARRGCTPDATALGHRCSAISHESDCPMVRARSADVDVYFRRMGGVVLRNRRPLAKAAVNSGTTTHVL